MVEKLSTNPAKIINIDRGNIGVGKTADIVIADPNEEYKIDENSFLSKSNNMPFHGRQVKGRVICTLVAGKVVYKHL